MYELKMPSLGADMDEGVLSRWLVAPGDRVAPGNVVALVETVKSELEMEAFRGGVVEELRVAEGERVMVGTVLALLRTDDEGAAPPAPEGERVRASPAARRAAARAGIDLAAVAGKGPEGAVLLSDLSPAPQARSAPSKPPPAEEPSAIEEPSSPEKPAARAARERAEAMRAIIAAAMARSKREIPHYYLATTIDLSRARAWIDQANRERPVTGRLLPVALLLKATALALRGSPELNGSWEDGAFRPAEAIHLGIGISLRGGGLVAPAIHRADEKSVDELMAALSDLVQRARAGRLRGSEMSDPTITVTNLGDQGVEAVFGVIYPPQVALVGFGKVVERPWAEGGMIGARPTVTATLAADHRASVGHQGARFLAAVDALLQRPEDL